MRTKIKKTEIDFILHCIDRLQYSSNDTELNHWLEVGVDCIKNMDWDANDLVSVNSWTNEIIRSERVRRAELEEAEFSPRERKLLKKEMEDSRRRLIFFRGELKNIHFNLQRQQKKYMFHWFNEYKKLVTDDRYLVFHDDVEVEIVFNLIEEVYKKRGGHNGS